VEVLALEDTDAELAIPADAGNSCAAVVSFRCDQRPKESDTRTHGQQRESRLARLSARLSYANVAATLALFLALTGTATAAVTCARDSVGLPARR
jgi:hypothetical protein